MQEDQSRVRTPNSALVLGTNCRMIFLGIIGRGAAGDGFVHQIGDGVQPRRRVWTRGKARVQRWANECEVMSTITL